MIDIRKLGLPLILVGPLVGGALVAGGAWATGKDATKVLTARAEKLEERAERQEARQAATDVTLGELRTDVRYLTEAMRRLEDKLGTR